MFSLSTSSIWEHKKIHEYMFYLNNNIKLTIIKFSKLMKVRITLYNVFYFIAKPQCDANGAFSHQYFVFKTSLVDTKCNILNGLNLA